MCYIDTGLTKSILGIRSFPTIRLAVCTEHSINQSIKFIISVAHCRLDFIINSRKNTSAMLNVNTTKITIVVETRKCLSKTNDVDLFSLIM